MYPSLSHCFLFTWCELIKLLIYSSTRVVTFYLTEVLPQQMWHAFPLPVTVYYIWCLKWVALVSLSWHKSARSPCCY